MNKEIEYIFVSDYEFSSSSASDVFITKDFIAYIHSNLTQISDNNIHKILDRLCKKIDLKGKIYSQYSVDLSMSKSKQVVSVKDNIKLLDILLHFSMLCHDLKYFNTALKLFDLNLKFIDQTTQQYYNNKITIFLNELK